MTTVFDLLETAEQYAASTYSIAQLDDAVKFIADVQALCGAKSISAEHDAMARADRIMRGIALRMYQGDQRKATSFINGYAWHRTADGADVAFDERDDREAWESGRAASPDFLMHRAAQAAANEAFRAKFNQEAPSTAKGWAYWIKQYHAAFSSRPA